MFLTIGFLNSANQTRSCHPYAHLLGEIINVVYYRKEEEIVLNAGKSMKQVTPLVDLQVIDDLLMLINAINEFRNCGSVVQIQKLFDIYGRWNIQIGENGETLSYAFEQFDYGTNANNLTAVRNGILLLKGMKKCINDASCLNEAEKLLLMDISTDFEGRFDVEGSDCPVSKLMIHLAQWYHDQGREGNAAITVQEAITTCLMERYSDRITPYLAEHKKFPLEEDLKKEENLSGYNWRKGVVDKLRMTLENNSKNFEGFYEAYEYIRENIRNVAAHTLMQREADEPQNYKHKIEYMIEYMINEIDRESQIPDYPHAKHSFDILIDRMFLDEDIKLLDRMLLHIEQELTVKDLFSKNVDLLRTQILIMKNSENFNIFYKKKADLGVLFRFLDEWIKGDGIRENSENEYKKRFSRNSKGKMGYERLINYMKTNEGHIALILKEMDIEMSSVL